MQDPHVTIKRLEAALERGHGTTENLFELARLKFAAGDANGAVSAYRQCVERSPPDAGLYNNFGAALIRARRFTDAIDWLETALRLRPGYIRALVNLGKALREIGRLDAAEAALRNALTIDSQYVPALVNLGEVLAAAGALSAAQTTLETAVRCAPGAVEPRTALGIVLVQAGRELQGIAELRAAVDADPQHPDAHANLAHALFMSGDWRAAWPHFEHRFRRHAHGGRLRVPAGMTRWDDAQSGSEELWLIGEQGLGDQVQFSRYARLVSDLGVRCVLAVDPRLVALLSQAPLASRIVPFGTVPDCPSARWAPLMSMPAWHGTGPDTVPSPAGYLSADQERVASWRARLSGGRLTVALNWRGNTSMETGRAAGRSPGLHAMTPLFFVPRVRFVSLQKGPGEEEIGAAPFGSSLLQFGDLDAGSDAFLDSSALLKCVDLLITSDTAIAHVAGAMGVATWLCLAHDPDWRWMRSGAESPWYQSLRLFRQPAPGDWNAVFHRIADELARLAGQQPAATQGPAPTDR